jgi:hypothetical protein
MAGDPPMTETGEPNPGWPIGCQVKVVSRMDQLLLHLRKANGTYLGEAPETSATHRIIIVRPSGKQKPRTYWAGYWKRMR